MKRIQLLFTAIICIIVFETSCKKEIPTGVYIGEFHYTYPSTWPDQTVWYRITESNNDFLLIGKTDYNGNLLSTYLDTIFLTDKKIRCFVASNNFIPFELIGEWSKKRSKKLYFIEGTFSQTDNTQGGVFIYSGTFEIKSN